MIAFFFVLSTSTQHIASQPAEGPCGAPVRSVLSAGRLTASDHLASTSFWRANRPSALQGPSGLMRRPLREALGCAENGHIHSQSIVSAPGVAAALIARTLAVPSSP